MTIEQIRAFVIKWKISKTLLAEKTGIGKYTLQEKLAGKQKRYHFTDDDVAKLNEVLKEMAGELTF